MQFIHKKLNYNMIYAYFYNDYIIVVVRGATHIKFEQKPSKSTLENRT